MEGYTQSEYHEFDDEEDEEDEEFILKLKQSKTVKYSIILKEEEFIED